MAVMTGDPGMEVSIKMGSPSAVSQPIAIHSGFHDPGAPSQNDWPSLDRE
jgi:hypothetical protein